MIRIPGGTRVRGEQGGIFTKKKKRSVSVGLALANKSRPREKTNDDTNSGTRLNRFERRLGLVQSEEVTGVAVTASRQAKVGGWKEGKRWKNVTLTGESKIGSTTPLSPISKFGHN